MAFMNITNDIKPAFDNMIPMESCKEMCIAQCKNYVWSAISDQYLSLLVIALALFALYFYSNKNFDKLLAKVRENPMLSEYPEKNFRIFIDIILVLGAVLVVVFIILLKNGIRLG